MTDDFVTLDNVKACRVSVKASKFVTSVFPFELGGNNWADILKPVWLVQNVQHSIFYIMNKKTLQDWWELNFHKFSEHSLMPFEVLIDASTQVCPQNVVKINEASKVSS